MPKNGPKKRDKTKQFLINNWAKTLKTLKIAHKYGKKEHKWTKKV